MPKRGNSSGKCGLKQPEPRSAIVERGCLTCGSVLDRGLFRIETRMSRGTFGSRYQSRIGSTVCRHGCGGPRDVPARREWLHDLANREVDRADGESLGTGGPRDGVLPGEMRDGPNHRDVARDYCV